MLKVTIQSIELQNFKGFYNAKIDFDEKKNVLYGKSGCGKSTIRDAWLWVCGLDIESPNPSINNQIIPDLETVVKCRISTNNGDYLISRKSKQKWKSTESGDKVFNGFDASNYEFDGIPMNSTTYRDKICKTFEIPKYEYIKFLCDSNYFNEDKSGWDYKKRREILFKIGDVDKKTEELANLPQFKLIKTDLDKGLTTAEITKSLNSSSRALSEAKKDNLTRITERTNDIAIDYDFVALKEELKQKENLYREKSSELNCLNNESDIIKIEKTIAEKQNTIEKLKLVDEKNRNSVHNDKISLSYSIDSIRQELKLKQEAINNLKLKKDEIKNSKYSVSICPVCKQEICTDKSPEEAIAKFEENKKNAIKELTDSIKRETKIFEDNKIKLEDLLVKLNNLNNIEIKEHPQISELRQEIEKLEIEKQEKSKSNDTKQLQFELQALENDIRGISAKLNLENIKKSAEIRIQQLQKENLEIAKQERELALKRQCNEDYLISTIKLVNDSINSMFDNISWNLFSTYNADAEKNYKEECEVMFDNKLYSQCSTGQKLIANFYTVIGLQNAFNVSLPIFFDEAQSSTYNRKCEQQLIELETNTKETNIDGIRIKLNGDE